MKINNLLKNPNVLPESIGTPNESNDVYLVYRRLHTDENDKWGFDISFGRGFYNYDENLWYGYYNDNKCRIADLFTETGGQEWDDADSLIEQGVPEELIKQLNPVPLDFAYTGIEDGYLFTTEIVGWFEMPTWYDFQMEE